MRHHLVEAHGGSGFRAQVGALALKRFLPRIRRRSVPSDMQVHPREVAWEPGALPQRARDGDPAAAITLDAQFRRRKTHRNRAGGEGNGACALWIYRAVDPVQLLRSGHLRGAQHGRVANHADIPKWFRVETSWNRCRALYQVGRNALVLSEIPNGALGGASRRVA